MSIETGAVQRAESGPVQAPAVRGPEGRDPAPGADEASIAGHQDAVRVDSLPASPPPELSDEIALAGAAADQLQASGRQLHFGLDPDTGKVSVEVHDLSGKVLGTIPPSKALEIAGGGELE